MEAFKLGMISIKYFASLRERLGRAEDKLPAGNYTVEDVWTQLNPQHPRPPNLLCAVNMEYSAWNTKVRDGDEVAFFPPVTGGAV